MLVGLYIFVDDEYDDPIYADPAPEEIDRLLWQAACEHIDEALEDDGPARGVVEVGVCRVGWRIHLKMGLSFVGIVRKEVSDDQLMRYLDAVHVAYMDEVDDARKPDRAGVEDVIIDVVAPWEDDEED
jgi:hypothetical protein